MDRLDSWLNAQRGWKRDALLWLNIGPVTIMLCAWVWSWTGWTGWVAVPAVLGVAIWLAVRRPQDTRPRRARKNKKRSPPGLSWRRMLATALISASQIVDAYFIGNDGTAMYRHWHRAFGAANAIVAVVFLVLVLAETWSARQMSRRATAEAQG